VSEALKRQVLDAVIDAVAVSGVDDERVLQIADAMGISKSKLENLFGGVDQLQAEALIEIYRDYVDYLHHQTKTAGSDPAARFRARVMAQVIYSLDKPGWGVILDYPALNPRFTEMLRTNYGSSLNQLFEVNMARLAQCILDVQGQCRELTEVTAENLNRDAYLANTELVRLNASIAWSILGMSVWSSGRHTPSIESAEIDGFLQSMIDTHIDGMINQIVNSPVLS